MVDDPRELDVAGRTLLVGTGQYFATFGHVRLTVLDVGSNRPMLQWDGGVRRSMLPQIFDELDRRARAVHAGELDTMHATPWRHAWTTRASNFTLWDRISRRVWSKTSGSRILPGCGAGTIQPVKFGAATTGVT